jgi:hypothetical protein
MILVPLFDLKFLNEIAAGDAGTSNRRHWSAMHVFSVALGCNTHSVYREQAESM